MKKLFYLLCFLIYFGSIVCAQDIHLSQFFETPLLRNPALAGIFTGDVRVQGVYRDQWRAVGYAYTTKTLSAEYKFVLPESNDYMTVGLQAFYDMAGATRLNTVELLPAINFHKSLSADKNMFLSAGFAAGVVQRNFDDKKLTFDNQYFNGSFDPTAPSGENFSYFKARFADLATGLSFNSSLFNGGNFYLGASVYHFNKPAKRYNEVQFFLEPKFQGNAGVKTPLGVQTELLFEANYLKQGSYSETIAGGELMYYLTDMSESANIKSLAFGAGAFIRLNDAIIPVLKLNYNNMEVSFSYDVNISRLSAATTGRGGYEVSLSYKGFTQSPNSSLNMVRCPRF
jgi:type IX secretion system PorP/SprF family membrane protein